MNVGRDVEANPGSRQSANFALPRGGSGMTVRKSLNVLERERYILRDGTRGTFVARPRLTLRIGSFSQEVTRSGGQAGAKVI